VIVLSFPSIRPATSQPSPIDTAVMIPSAIPDSVSNWFSSMVRCSLRQRCAWAWSWAGDGGGDAVSWQLSVAARKKTMGPGPADLAVPAWSGAFGSCFDTSR